MIITIDDCREEMLKDFLTGQEKGSTTYYSEFDNCWTWRQSEMTLVSGYSSEGKSLFLKQMALIKFLAEGKKFLFCSPEDYPPKSFYDDMIHTLSGKSTDIGKYGAITQEEYNICMDRISDGIRFLHLKYPDNTIPNALAKAKEVIDKEGDIFGLVIDPILKFSRPVDVPDREDLYAGFVMTITTEFARDNNICLLLVMHQLTPRVDNDGFFLRPSGYMVKGGGGYFDGTDNMIYVWRPKYAKDKLDPSVTVGSLKIKKQKLVGIPQSIEDSILFDRKTNRYVDKSNRPIFDFDKYKLK